MAVAEGTYYNKKYDIMIAVLAHSKAGFVLLEIILIHSASPMEV